MAVPLIVAGVVAGGVAIGAIKASEHQVKKEQAKAISIAKDEAFNRIELEIDKAVKLLNDYENKILQEILFLILCVLIMVALIFSPAYNFFITWITIFVLGRSIHLLAKSFALYLTNSDVNKVTKLIWNHWTKNKPRFQLRDAIESALRIYLRDCVDNIEVRDQINMRVNDKIKSLSTLKLFFYNIFGDKRMHIANRILDEVIYEVDFGQLIKRTSQVLRKIILVLLFYITIAFIWRFIALNLSGFQYGLLLISGAVFLAFWSFIQLRTMKSMESVKGVDSIFI